MFHDVFRIVGAALADSSIGVAEQLRSIPREATERSVPAPKVRNLADNPEIAQGLMGPSSPVLDVTEDGLGVWQANGNPGLLTRAAVLPIRLDYLTRERDPGQAVTDGLRTIWAAILCLREFMRSDHALERVRNGVELVGFDGEQPIQAGRNIEPLGEDGADGWMTASALVALLVKDSL